MKLIEYKTVSGGGGSPRPPTDVREASEGGRPKTVLVTAIVIAVLMLTSAVILYGDEAVEVEGATSGTCGDGLTWSVNTSNYLTISGSGSMQEFSSVGPWGTGIEGVEIREGVTSITANAFKGCTSLSRVYLSHTITSIGSEAFSGCTSLEFIYMYEGVTSIESKSFSGCGKFKLIMPDGQASNGDFILPESVMTIGSEAFYGCTLMKYVSLSTSLTSIGKEAFYQCTGLKEVTIPNTVTSLGERAFGSCSSLEYVYLSTGIDAIQNYTFKGCKALESINIPNSVTDIGAGAFDNCMKLTEIVFPDSITTVADNAFSSHTFYDTDGATLLEKTVDNLKGSTFKGADVNRMIKQSGDPTPAPDDPDDSGDTDDGSKGPVFIIIPDNRDDDFPGYVPVQKTGDTSDDSSYVAVIVGVIAAILAIMVVLLYRKD